MAAYDRLVGDGAAVTELHHSCEIDAESQTDLQGLKTKVIEAEALESSGLVEALVGIQKVRRDRHIRDLLDLEEAAAWPYMVSNDTASFDFPVVHGVIRQAEVAIIINLPAIRDL